MQSQNRLLDDLAKVGTGVCGLALGVKDELKRRLRHKAEGIAKDLDLVRREEFNVVRDMAQKARLEVEHLKAKLKDDH